MGHFCPPGSGSTDLIESEDPKPCQKGQLFQAALAAKTCCSSAICSCWIYLLLQFAHAMRPSPIPIKQGSTANLPLQQHLQFDLPNSRRSYPASVLRKTYPQNRLLLPPNLFLLQSFVFSELYSNGLEVYPNFQRKESVAR